ncbi:hypothetical protein HDU88_002394 [Geranomyces variabilis]|nr:hypothetical protein HDU88_002394 [Geranomyces variabilis]
MTNTNTSSQTLGSRRITSVVAPALPPTASESFERGASSDTAGLPVRVKVSRNRSPDYLTEALELEQPSSASAVPGKRAPLFTTVQASTFSDSSSSPESGVLTKRNGENEASGPADEGHPQAAPKPLNLPTQWNQKDKNQTLDISTNGQRITYSGLGEDDKHAGAVRSNYCIPPQCGLFYYEVTIISKGRDGYIAIGFSTQSVQLNRLPGWEENSWGYHGDDGHSFCCSGTGRKYGPSYTTGDVIGCIVNFMSGTISFTKNGVWLGVAFKNAIESIKGDAGLFPSVGLRTPGEIVESNFGQSEFKFDIDHHYKEEKARIWSEINAMPLPTLSAPTDEQADASSDINQLILSYLIHHGYSETAATFQKDTASMRASPGTAVVPFDKEDIRKRQLIRDHIVEGDIDEAVMLLDEFYPTILAQNSHLAFQLKSQRFIELMRTVTAPSNAMDVDGPSAPAPNSGEDDMRSVVSYGQAMQGEFGAFENPLVQSALVETYSLLAYRHPSDSAVSYLLDPANRLLVADVVNRSILKSQNRPAVPAIENVYRQASAVAKELFDGGSGAAAFVKARECL